MGTTFNATMKPMLKGQNQNKGNEEKDKKSKKFRTIKTELVGARV